MRKKEDRKFILLPAVLAVTLAAVFLYLLLGDPPAFKELEKEYRAEFPEVSAESVLSGDFSRNFEAYVNDAVPFRTAFVGLNSYVTLLTGRQNTTAIWRDRKGNLLEAPVDGKEETLVKNVRKVSEFAEQTGKKVYLVLPPSAGYCDADLPGLYRNCFRDDRYLSEIRKQLSEKVVFPDLSERFLTAGNPLYYRTDHHWNRLGTELCYEALCPVMGLSKAFGAADSAAAVSLPDFCGTTYSRSGLWFTPPDEISASDPGIPVKVRFSDEEAIFDSLYFTEKYKDSPDKYPVFLDGNHPVTYIETGALTGRSLMIVKDSFALSLVPLLVRDFDRIVLVDLRYCKEPVSELCERENTDEVLFLYSLSGFLTDANIVWLR